MVAESLLSKSSLVNFFAPKKRFSSIRMALRGDARRRTSLVALPPLAITGRRRSFCQTWLAAFAMTVLREEHFETERCDWTYLWSVLCFLLSPHSSRSIGLHRSSERV